MAGPAKQAFWLSETRSGFYVFLSVLSRLAHSATTRTVHGPHEDAAATRLAVKDSIDLCRSQLLPPRDRPIFGKLHIPPVPGYGTYNTTEKHFKLSVSIYILNRIAIDREMSGSISPLNIRFFLERGIE